uniref:Putative DNA binding protein n=1 Tax=Gokushovirinae environmental samples TaxID=1478972 RepID=A0A2R3UAF9_9VIRU|nr:putative DNA binding protein [Gokushovirinae environmental samples]
MKSEQKKGSDMRRRKMSRKSSRKSFRKNTGVHKVNHFNPRSFRGGIRL